MSGVIFYRQRNITPPVASIEFTTDYHGSGTATSPGTLFAKLDGTAYYLEDPSRGPVNYTEKSNGVVKINITISKLNPVSNIQSYVYPNGVLVEMDLIGVTSTFEMPPAPGKPTMCAGSQLMVRNGQVYIGSKIEES